MVELPKINILFEDNHLLVVEKPINIPVCEDESKDLDLLSILKKTKYGIEGMGGIITKGTMYVGYPR